MLDVLHNGVDERRVGDFEEAREDRPLDLDRNLADEFVIALNSPLVLLQLSTLVAQESFRSAELLAVVEMSVSARGREKKLSDALSASIFAVDKHFLKSAIF